MIKLLKIKNIAVIEEAELELEPGFVVLTGETGAGKSIIIGGLKLLLGEKPDPDMIRTGQERATVEAIMEKDGEEVVVTREITKTRSKALLNDRLVSSARLKEEISRFVDIFGQRDHYFLLDPLNHLLFVDSFAGLDSLREEVAELYRKIKDLEGQLQKLRAEKEERERKLDFLRFQIEEIEKAGLREGEEEELLQKREVLKNREKLKELLSSSLSLLQEEGGLNEKLWALEKNLGELAPYISEIEHYREEVSRAIDTLTDLVPLLEDQLEKLLSEEESIDQVEERLSLIERLKRKYGSSIKEILRFAERARQEVARLEGLEFDEEKLEKEIEALKAQYMEKAKELSEKRKGAAEKLSAQVEELLKKLAMARPVFKVKFIPQQEISELGLEQAEFLFSANPGEEPRPLRKIASGGELSRIMLALKTLFAEKGRTFVFDEIDTGIGGRTASLLGKMLRQLAEKCQVIVVTHLPQVAAFADQHFRVEKVVRGGKTYTLVKEVKGEERVKEIARMLVGEKITESALRSAKQLLERQ